MSPTAGELVTETFEYDGGRQVTAYVPPASPEAVVFAGDGQLITSRGGVLEAAGLPPTMIKRLSGAASLRRVADKISYACQRCGGRHRGLPMSYGTDAPAYWDPSLAGDESSSLEQEHCIIKDEHFFVRGRLVIPVTDAVAGTEFDWGVWVSLSRGNFTRALSLRTTPGREREQPYFGWLSTELPLYQPSTLSLKTRVHTQAVGRRPLIELEPTDHPLAVEQRTGITLARVQEIAETLLHALPAAGLTHRHMSRARWRAHSRR